MGRILVPPGNYPNIDAVIGASGVITASGVADTPNDSISSAKVPRGLKVTYYQNRDYGGLTLAQPGGSEWGNFSDFKKGCCDNWNETVSSLRVSYAP
jgi:hypothetical protein